MRVPELLLRAVLATTVAALTALGFGERACDLFRPLFRTFIEACVPGVVVRGLDVVRESGVDMLVAVIFPAQSVMVVTIPPGAMIASVTVGGVLLPVELALAVGLAWPIVGKRDACLRAVTLAALLPLLMLGGPLTLAAECLDALREVSGQEGAHPLMVVSRLLMGGGSAALGLVVGMTAVLAGRR